MVCTTEDTESHGVFIFLRMELEELRGTLCTLW